MDALFEAIRAACSATCWSRGVELARAGAVTAEREDTDATLEETDEIVVRVATRGGLVSPSVTLYPRDQDWECDCPSRDAACEHAAAAVIAVRRARRSGEPLAAAAEAAGRVRYSFRRRDGALDFEREVTGPDGSRVLEQTLAAIASGRVDGPRFVATPDDLRVESALGSGSQRRGTLTREVMTRLLPALTGCAAVQLDGEPVGVSGEPIRPHVRVEDAAGGFRLLAVADPELRETFCNGVGLCAGELRPLGESRLTGRELEDLPSGRFYAQADVAELVTEVLPSLAERLPIDIQTRRLPQTSDDPPRVRIEVRQNESRLSLLPLLVYGTPPRARIDAGKLVHLSGAVPRRDRQGEQRATSELQRAFGLAPGHRVSFGGDEAIEIAERLAHWPGEIAGDAHRGFERGADLVPRLELGDADFSLHFDCGDTADEETRTPRRASAEAVLHAWQVGDHFAPLMGGGFAALPTEWLERFGHRVADLLAARGEGAEPRQLPACALPDLARLCDDLDQPRPPALAALASLLDDFAGVPETPPPNDLTAELRGYQRQGVDRLRFLGEAGLGALLADDMGLGKTLQTLCALRGHTLVVAPTSVLHNWRDEIARFRPGLRAHLYHGAERALDPSADVTLTSYAVLRIDVEALVAERWDTLVLDEAQAIKNPDSQVAQAARRLQADFRIALTGTPVENRLEELWSQLHFLNPGLLGTRSDFRERYDRPIGAGDAAAVARLRERIRPFVLRRLKREVARELPPRSEVVLRCELHGEEREIYDAVRASVQQSAVRQLEAGGSVMQALEALLRLRQAACHGALVPGQSLARSSKLSLLRDRLREAADEGHRALVFSQWTSLLDLVEPELADAELAFERLDGTTRDRAGVVRRFQAEQGPPVLLASLKAGGVGLNLTAADHVFLLDPWWNPAVEDQAADRAHRIGQERPVVVHRLVAIDTVEERILELQSHKRSIAEAALADTELTKTTTLGRDDLLALLR